MSDGHPIPKFTIPCRNQEWIRVLTDSSEVATFACVTTSCLETSDCKCKAKNWARPNEFRLSTRVGRYCSGGVGHVDEEPRLAGCHVLNSLSVMRLQPNNNIHLSSFILFYQSIGFFTCIQSTVISFVLVSGYNQAFILHKSYMRYTAQSGGAILAFRSPLQYKKFYNGNCEKAATHFE